MQCGKCHETFFIPSIDKAESNGTYLAEPLPTNVIKISCPKCTTNYELTSEFIGQQVECNTCSKLFVIKKPEIITPNKLEPQLGTVPEKSIEEETKPPTPKKDFFDDRTVKLKKQSDGKPQGMIPDYGPTKQTNATPAPSQANANIPDHFPVFCPQCGLKYEVTKELIGEQAECECSHLFKITAPQPKPATSSKLEKNPVAPATPSTSSKTKTTAKPEPKSKAKPTSVSIPWYMFWKRLFGKS